jgi:hypothetical protein
MNTSHDPNTQSLLNDLQNGSITKRRAAAYKLGKLKNPAAVPALIKAANNPDPTMRQNAINALRDIKSEEALEFLATVHFAPTPKHPIPWGSLVWGISLFLGINFVLTQARASFFRYMNAAGSSPWIFDLPIMISIVVINLITFIYLIIKHRAIGVGMLMGIPTLLILWFVAILLFYKPY